MSLTVNPTLEMCQRSNVETPSTHINTPHVLRKELFNLEFSLKDLLKQVGKIVLSPPTDMWNHQGSIKDIVLWGLFVAEFWRKRWY